MGDKKKGYVLIVEDDSDLRMTMSLALQEHGFKAICAQNGLDALRRLVDQKHVGRPCLILLDVNMPVMTGWELLSIMALMKDECYDIPVVLVTGDIVPEIITSGSSGRHVEAIHKPASLEAIVEAVKKHCAPG